MCASLTLLGAGVRVAMAEETPKAWAGSIAYALSTDLADTGSPVLFSHGLGLKGALSLPKDWKLGAGLGMSARSLGTEILTQPSIAELDNVQITLSRKVGADFRGTVGLDLPLCSFCVAEGFRGIPTFQLTHSWNPTWRPKGTAIALEQGMVAKYILNTYTHSPRTLTPNPDWTIAYAAVPSITLSDRFSFSLSLALVHSSILDGSSVNLFETAASIGFKERSFSAALALGNKGPMEEGRFSLWFLDTTQRYFTLELGYAL